MAAGKATATRRPRQLSEAAFLSAPIGRTGVVAVAVGGGEGQGGGGGEGGGKLMVGGGGGLAALLPPVSPLSQPGGQAVLGSPAPR